MYCRLQVQLEHLKLDIVCKALLIKNVLMRTQKETEIFPRDPIIYSFLDVFFFSTSYPFTVSLSIRRTFIPGPLSSIIFVTYCLTAKITFIIAYLSTNFEFPRRKSTQISEEKSPLISPNHISPEAIFIFVTCLSQSPSRQVHFV